jgi:hypothetical protein
LRSPIPGFNAEVQAWLASAKHPRFGKPYDQLTYQPMQELLRYLRARGFKTYIVSGGGADFMRVWSERVYGIPPERLGDAGKCAGAVSVPACRSIPGHSH